MARDALADRGGGLPVHTLSMVYRDPPLLARETPYIEAALAGKVGVEAHRLPGDDFLDPDCFADPTPADEPCQALWQSAMSPDGGLWPPAARTGQ